MAISAAPFPERLATCRLGRGRGRRRPAAAFLCVELLLQLPRHLLVRHSHRGGRRWCRCRCGRRRSSGSTAAATAARLLAVKLLLQHPSHLLVRGPASAAAAAATAAAATATTAATTTAAAAATTGNA
jgi:hypothetical protein